jgi:uncharacterized protein YegJ (DUF2314 family)
MRLLFIIRELLAHQADLTDSATCPYWKAWAELDDLIDEIREAVEIDDMSTTMTWRKTELHAIIEHMWLDQPHYTDEPLITTNNE